MLLPRFTSLLVAAALTSAPIVAYAAPATITHTQLAHTRVKAAAPIADADDYAAREVKSPSVAEFRGGSETLFIGGSTLAIVLLVVLVVVLL